MFTSSCFCTLLARFFVMSYPVLRPAPAAAAKMTNDGVHRDEAAFPSCKGGSAHSVRKTLLRTLQHNKSKLQLSALNEGSYPRFCEPAHWKLTSTVWNYHEERGGPKSPQGSTWHFYDQLAEVSLCNGIPPALTHHKMSQSPEDFYNRVRVIDSDVAALLSPLWVLP